jgi:Holliday junction resolvasome RuvABC endonuclease subunit
MTKEFLVLAIHATTRGFGWALFEGPDLPVDWGRVDIRKTQNPLALQRIEELLEEFKPQVLVLEAADKNPRRTRRLRKLYRAVERNAQARGIEVKTFSRADINLALVHTAEASRERVAAAVVARLPALEPTLPAHRKPWQSERAAMALFSAFACAMTYFAPITN